MKRKIFLPLALLTMIPGLCAYSMQEDLLTIFLIGDSTLADYTGNYDRNNDYMKRRYPLAAEDSG